MIAILGLGISFLQMFLGQLNNQAPAQVVVAVSAAITALTNHQNDLITKANLEAQRG